MQGLEDRKDEIRKIIRAHRDPRSQARRVYLDRPSFAMADKHDIEFEIKSKIADRYKIPFRSVIFTGSAHLGFSPQKDTEFEVGVSDLDVAAVSSDIYLHFWHEILRVSRGFTDESVFSRAHHIERLKDHILRRGMILLDYMPNCTLKTSEMSFLDALGRRYNLLFGRIALAFYLSEEAFCYKQRSALIEIMGIENG